MYNVLQILAEEVTYKNIIKAFKISLGNGKIINITRNVELFKDGNDEFDWEHVNTEDEKIIDKLTEEELDQLDKFIMEKCNMYEESI